VSLAGGPWGVLQVPAGCRQSRGAAPVVVEPLAAARRHYRPAWDLAAVVPGQPVPRQRVPAGEMGRGGSSEVSRHKREGQAGKGAHWCTHTGGDMLLMLQKRVCLAARSTAPQGHSGSPPSARPSPLPPPAELPVRLHVPCGSPLAPDSSAAAAGSSGRQQLCTCQQQTAGSSGLGGLCGCLVGELPVQRALPMQRGKAHNTTALSEYGTHDTDSNTEAY
jgi:hypothetical protein